MTDNLNKALSQRPDIISDLLNAASKKLGCDPKALKKGLETGDLSGIGDKGQAQEIKRLMNDPEAVKKLMSDPKAAAMLKKLSGR